MKRKIAMVMTVVSLLALAGGCSSGKQQNTASNKLRYWLPLNSQLNSLASNLGETPFGQELQKATGTEIEFIHPNSSDQFALMLSSGDMPDIIEADWATYNGGPEKSIADGYIMNLNDVMKDKAPNIKVYLKEHPEIDKMVKTDEGNYYVFPFIRGDEELLVSTGPIVRKDWLDDLGMELPETMDDWHTMLTRFKNEKGASTPLSFMNYSAMFNYGAFIGAYGINNTFFVQDKRYIEQYSSLPQQQEALKLWMDTDAEQHILPTLAFSSDQSSELADIMSTITTYQDEQMVKFIMGTRSIDEFDDYVNEMKKMGIEKAIEIYQAAYDTYDKN